MIAPGDLDPYMAGMGKGIEWAITEATAAQFDAILGRKEFAPANPIQQLTTTIFPSEDRMSEYHVDGFIDRWVQFSAIHGKSAELEYANGFRDGAILGRFQ